ncbi:MAG: 50S ribosomal protein L11 methyltransferase [Gammaproteobacteria bacterium]|nr:50S ribosomal protein L11 methyltransferase [Gammaproteobacteria bacterium]
MSWLRLSIPVAQDQAESLSDALEAAGALAVSFEDAGDDPQFEPQVGATPLWVETVVTGLFSPGTSADEVLGPLRGNFPGTELAREDQLTEDELQQRTMQNAEPLLIGNRIWVGPHGAQVPSARDIVIRLAPGLAFGTGRHPTTAMCLAALEQYVRADSTVVDYGCGSGILAIGAIRLGARAAWAFDLDPQALISTETNAADNGVSAAIEVVDSAHKLPEQVDLIAANILAKPLISLSKEFAKMLAEGGTVLLSGLLADQREEVTTAFSPWFDFDPPVMQEGWAMVGAVRNRSLVGAE